SAAKVVLQQFNRLQNTNRLLLADAATGEVTTVMTETDAAWVENSNTGFRWLDGGKKLVWLSERSGWRHVYAVSMVDGAAKPITHGAFDLIGIEAIDEK